jgi:NADPH:quinone reductase-like Zn-dependent oxidoreductase
VPIRAEAWFVHAAGPGEEGRPAQLVRERHELPDLLPHEVLVAPLFGCWEANMGHALARRPIDVCAANGWPRRILGNGGVARIVQAGPQVRGLSEGQSVLMCGFEPDPWGYPRRVMGYDSALTGFLTTRLKLAADHVLPLPEGTRHDPARWAAFNVRYLTAWSNWRLAYGTFRLQLDEQEFPRLNVWAWGGGTGLAEAQLAALLGHRGAALASRPDRLQLAADCGVLPVDRTAFPDLSWDEARDRADPAYARAYRVSEEAFLATVREKTGGEGVQIFVDMIGPPVFRATARALGPHGVIATAGWKAGMQIRYSRSIASISHHQLVHTHFIRHSETAAALAFAERHAWLPIIDERIFDFDEIPELAARYAAGDYRMYPCYRVNP